MESYTKLLKVTLIGNWLKVDLIIMVYLSNCLTHDYTLLSVIRT